MSEGVFVSFLCVIHSLPPSITLLLGSKSLNTDHTHGVGRAMLPSSLRRHCLEFFWLGLYLLPIIGVFHWDVNKATLQKLAIALQQGG